MIMDLGSETNDAMVLQKYHSILQAEGYELIFVINANCPNERSANEVMKTIKQIEQSSKLTVTGLINNTNFGCEETSVDNLLDGLKLQKMLVNNYVFRFIYDIV
ncbi:hypothetical protein KHA80_01615 [Anaerobacillus sp. HL2]|nr:hypothetical protein KHA80_01615 [Anaerobacillus sp. HL2]